MEEKGTPTQMLDVSNRFYTLLPHDFGMKKPPMLDTAEIIKTKTEMLDNLLEIEVGGRQEWVMFILLILNLVCTFLTTF